MSNRTFISRSSGLGLATVEKLAEDGGFVAIIDLKEPESELKHSNRTKFFRTDITKLEEIEKAVVDTMHWVSQTGAHLGGIVNCAGVGVAAKV